MPGEGTTVYCHESSVSACGSLPDTASAECSCSLFSLHFCLFCRAPLFWFEACLQPCPAIGLLSCCVHLFYVDPLITLPILIYVSKYLFEVLSCVCFSVISEPVFFLHVICF